MLIIPASVKVHLALGNTDLRKRLDSLATLVRDSLKQNPFTGHLFAFRGRKASTIKVLFWDRNGLCLFAKKLNESGFVWPRLSNPGGSVQLTPIQLALLIEGIDRRTPQKIWKPVATG